MSGRSERIVLRARTAQAGAEHQRGAGMSERIVRPVPSRSEVRA
ncbi:hypothetical protein [Nocardia amikacinitolerans]|nr:hypothetical protein [Nocardia amikacinitolerans]